MSKVYPDRIVEKTEILNIIISEKEVQVNVEDLPNDIQEEVKMMDYIRQKYSNLQYEVKMTEIAWKENYDKVNEMAVTYITQNKSL